MRDSRGRSSRPVSASRFMPAFLAGIQPETPLARIQAVWPAVVGERIASVTEVAEEAQGVVYVDCASAVWSQELSLMEPRLRGILADALEGDPPLELRFRTNS